jgi:hypothetical protein
MMGKIVERIISSLEDSGKIVLNLPRALSLIIIVLQLEFTLVAHKRLGTSVHNDTDDL